MAYMSDLPFIWNFFYTVICPFWQRFLEGQVVQILQLQSSGRTPSGRPPPPSHESPLRVSPDLPRNGVNAVRPLNRTHWTHQGPLFSRVPYSKYQGLTKSLLLFLFRGFSVKQYFPSFSAYTKCFNLCFDVYSTIFGIFRCGSKAFVVLQVHRNAHQ